MTSKSRSEKHIPLSIEAPDEGTEIFLVNDSFERIESGIGSLRKDVFPGLYKIRFRSGTTQEDRFLEVSATRKKVLFQEKEPLAFEATPPLLHTKTDNSRHRRIARKESQRVHLSAGKGSTLFLFVRHLETGTRQNPAEGITLNTLEGSKIADTENGIFSKTDGCWSLCIELDPGTYRLRVDTGNLGIFEMFVVTCKNWQTQFFGMTFEFTSEQKGKATQRLTRLLLKSSSVHMAKNGEGFNPASESLRLAELAKIALETGRTAVDERTFEKLFVSHADDPMFGIYGAHLLLNSRRPDYKVIDSVTEKLEKLVGPHPDVLSLWLRKHRERKQRKTVTLSSPPMLTRSWELLTRESIRRSSVVPEGSFSDLLSNGMLSTTPWLLHRLTPDSGAEGSSPSLSRTKEMLDNLAEISTTKKGYELLANASRQRTDLTQVEIAIMQTMLNQAKQTTRAQLTLNDLVESVKVPSVALKRSTNSLLAKLDLKQKKK